MGLSLQDKFPDLRPIASAPSLYTMNGIGTGVYGRRDYDDETGTYITTYCFCVLFVPLLAISAYRVADAPGGGYYFVGKTPLSAFAKAWNALLAAAVIGGVGFAGFQTWYNSPENVARRQLAAADRLVAANDHAGAAARFEELALGSTAQATPARERLEQWLAAPPAGVKPADRHAVWKSAVVLSQMGRWPAGPQPLHDQALALAEKIAAGDARLAVSLLKDAEPLDENPAASAARKRALLDKLHAAAPGDLDLTVQLAQAVEQEGNFERCETLLAPLAERLAGTEGARILGQCYVGLGKINEAHALLAPYCESRLTEYRAAMAAFESAFQAARDVEFEKLNKDAAFRRRYEAATEPERAQMVQDRIVGAVSKNVELAGKREAVRRSSRVVPTALDFGVVQLHRAQNLADPAARKAELERAEQTFLAIGDAVGESDRYQLNLGKVYYWLGKQSEGQKLLDEVLARNAGDFDMRTAVVVTLREVGAEPAARALAEQIFQDDADEAHRRTVARLRAAMFKDLDDQIEWLSHCDANDTATQAALAQARGNKALQDGDLDAAEQGLRKGAELYASFPEEAATLNNAALCYNRLFHVRGDIADLRQCAKMLDRAVALRADNSVLMTNAAELYYDLALAEACGQQIDLRLMQVTGHSGLLGCFYHDAAGRDQVIARLKVQPALAKALQYYDKAMLLAPKRAANYSQAASLHAALRDASALERLLKQVQDAQPDTQESVGETLKFIRGESDEKVAASLNGGLTMARQLADRLRAAPAGEKRSRSLATVQACLCGVLQQKSVLPAEPAPDADEILRQAEEAQATFDCSLTQQTVVMALLFRVHSQLAAKNAEYASFAAARRRHLPAYEILLLAQDNAALRSEILAHADFQRAVLLSKQRAQLFPQGGWPDVWMLVRYADAATAEQLAQRVRDDQLARLESQLDLRLNPAGTHDALVESWRLTCIGQPAEAAAVIQKLNALDVAWPQ